MSASGSLAEASGPRPSALCPLCGAPADRTLTARDLNRAVGDQRFEYARCGFCGSWFLLSPPADLSPYYPSEYYELPSAATLDELAPSQDFYIRLLLDRTEPGRLVEIGPGEGVFARAARNAGFQVSVIEMDHRACEHLRSVVGVEAIGSAEPELELPRLPPSCAVVMWQVIEHLRDPWAVIEQVAANLREGGVLALSTPNPGALQFKLMGSRWAHLDAPRHLYLIPPETLARRCAELGLRLVHTTTADPAGRHWNRFGWEYALRRSPRSHPGGRPAAAAARTIARVLAPVETRGSGGCSYTSVFVKEAPR
jgi:SAM-dependent methyltransferase